MPELPEVETIRRQLEPRLVGRRLVDGWAFDSPKFADAPSMPSERTVDSLGRRGKYLLAGLDDGRLLVVHLGMTGSLRMSRRRAGRRAPPRRMDPRRRRRLCSSATSADSGESAWCGRTTRPLPTLAALGPEPFDDALTPADSGGDSTPGAGT